MKSQACTASGLEWGQVRIGYVGQRGLEGQQKEPENEVELIKSVCDEIARVVNKSKGEDANKGGVEGEHTSPDTPELAVEERDIISLSDITEVESERLAEICRSLESLQNIFVSPSGEVS